MSDHKGDVRREYEQRPTGPQPKASMIPEGIERERFVITEMIGNFSNDVAELRGEVGELRDEVKGRAMLTEEEHAWVKLAIKREAQSIEFRQAIIEKALLALIISGILGACAFGWTVLKEYFYNHIPQQPTQPPK